MEGTDERKKSKDEIAPKEKKTSKFKIVIIITVVFFTLYLGALFIWASQKNVGTDYIQTGEIESSVNSGAYIVRDEVLINSPLTGSYIPSAEDGDKVASNYCIATVLNGMCNRITEVELLGGNLIIEWNEENNHVYMTGPARYSFDGVWLA